MDVIDLHNDGTLSMYDCRCPLTETTALTSLQELIVVVTNDMLTVRSPNGCFHSNCLEFLVGRSMKLTVGTA